MDRASSSRFMDRESSAQVEVRTARSSCSSADRCVWSDGRCRLIFGVVGCPWHGPWRLRGDSKPSRWLVLGPNGSG
jgi:hypothetical protein